MAMQGRGSGSATVLPCLVVITGLAMLLVAAYAVVAGEPAAANAFGSWAAFILASGGVFFFVFREGSGRATRRRQLRGEVALLLFLWLGLPLLAALPVKLIVPGFGLDDAWFEMVSGFTTTGATLLADPAGAPRSLLVWRSATQWLGGLATLVAVLAVLAPHGLGAWSLSGVASGVAATAASPAAGPGALASRRWLRAAIRVTPLYTAVTILLVFAYFLAGMNAFDAFNHALTTISTGGFSTHAESLAAQSSWRVEGVAAIGMLLGAIGIGTYARIWRGRWRLAGRDPELRLLAILLTVAALAAFLRHPLFRPPTAASPDWPLRLAEVAWSEWFAAVSALTTTGFPSAYAEAGIAWSGLSPAPVLLLGLAVVGGSAASTAGGVRLLSVSLLMRHSLDELERIGRPRHVHGHDRFRDGPGQLRTAWIGSMLFALAAATGILAVSLLGLDFEASLAAILTSLANAGPLQGALTGEPEFWSRIPSEARTICALFMALGRVGIVGVVAVLLLD